MESIDDLLRRYAQALLEPAPATPTQPPSAAGWSYYSLFTDPALQAEKRAIEAAKALGKIDDSRALSILQAAFLDRRLGVRRAIISSLPRGDERTKDLLILGLAEGDARIRRMSLEALIQLPPDPERLAWIIHALADEREDIRLVAIRALGGERTRQASDALLAALPAQPSKLQREIALNLGRMGDPATLEALEPLFCQPGGTCLALADGISSFRSHRAVEILLTRINDRRSTVRAAVVKALGQTKQPQAVPKLAQALQNDFDLTVRQNAIWSLSQLGGPLAAQELLKAARAASNQALSEAAAQALLKMETPSAAGPLLVIAQEAKGRWLGKQAADAYQALAQRWPLEVLFAAGNQATEPFHSQLRWFLNGLAEDQPDSKQLLHWLSLDPE